MGEPVYRYIVRRCTEAEAESPEDLFCLQYIERLCMMILSRLQQCDCHIFLACEHCCVWCTSTPEYSMSKVVFGATFHCAPHCWHYVFFAYATTLLSHEKK